MANTTIETLQLLEWRLHRLEHFLAPDAGEGAGTRAGEVAVVVRVKQLEHRLSELISKSPAAAQLIQLQATLPEMFIADADSKDERDAVEGNERRLHMVLSSAPQYPAMASNLTTLHEYPLRDPKELSALLSLQSRLEQFEATQDTQLGMISELRQKSIALLHGFYESHVLQSGENWSTHEERLVQAETTILRMEAARTREQEDG